MKRFFFVFIVALLMGSGNAAAAPSLAWIVDTSVPDASDYPGGRGLVSSNTRHSAVGANGAIGVVFEDRGGSGSRDYEVLALNQAGTTLWSDRTNCQPTGGVCNSMSMYPTPDGDFVIHEMLYQNPDCTSRISGYDDATGAQPSGLTDRTLSDLATSPSCTGSTSTDLGLVSTYPVSATEYDFIYFEQLGADRHIKGDLTGNVSVGQVDYNLVGDYDCVRYSENLGGLLAFDSQEGSADQGRYYKLDPSDGSVLITGSLVTIFDGHHETYCEPRTFDHPTNSSRLIIPDGSATLGGFMHIDTTSLSEVAGTQYLAKPTGFSDFVMSGFDIDGAGNVLICGRNASGVQAGFAVLNETGAGILDEFSFDTTGHDVFQLTDCHFDGSSGVYATFITRATGGLLEGTVARVTGLNASIIQPDFNYTAPGGGGGGDGPDTGVGVPGSDAAAGLKGFAEGIGFASNGGLFLFGLVLVCIVMVIVAASIHAFAPHAAVRAGIVAGIGTMMFNAIAEIWELWTVVILAVIAAAIVAAGGRQLVMGRGARFDEDG